MGFGEIRKGKWERPQKRKKNGVGVKEVEIEAQVFLALFVFRNENGKKEYEMKG